MAFERFKINPRGANLLSPLSGLFTNYPGVEHPAPPPPAPPPPETGGPLPPYQDPNAPPPATTPPPVKHDGHNMLSARQQMQQSFSDWMKNQQGGFNGIFAGFPVSGFGKGLGKKPKPPGTDKPTGTTPAAPPPQWANPTAPFPQNPYDIPAPLQPANNPWLASLPQRDWMTMPSASPGYQQSPPPPPWRPPY